MSDGEEASAATRLLVLTCFKAIDQTLNLPVLKVKVCLIEMSWDWRLGCLGPTENKTVFHRYFQLHWKKGENEYIIAV